MYVTFETPVYLWLLFSIPLFIISHFYFLRRSKSIAMSFANFDTLKRIGGDKILTKNMTQLILRIFVITALVVSLTGASLWREAQASSVDYVIAIDNSASMTAEDIKPNRFIAAKKYASDFISALGPGAKVGIVSFSGITTIEQLPTTSRIDVLLALENLQISKTGGTDITGAVITSTNLLIPTVDNGRAILVISDGVSTVNSFVSDSLGSSIKYAKDNQVVIHGIGIGSNTGPIGYLPQYYNISASFEGDTLKKLSEGTEGVYINAATSDELVQAFQYFSDLKKEKLIRTNLSFLTLLLALALIFVDWGLANTVYRRVL